MNKKEMKKETTVEWMNEWMKEKEGPAILLSWAWASEPDVIESFFALAGLAWPARDPPGYGGRKRRGQGKA